MTRAAAVPLFVVAAAVAVTAIGERFVSIGLIDLAKFQGFVVAPMWAAAPAAAGFAWRGFDGAWRTRAAIIDGCIIGGLTAAAIWWSTVSIACQIAPERTPLELALPSGVIGVVIGGGFAIACKVAAAGVAARPSWLAVAAGAFVQLASVGLAAILIFPMFYGLCQRP